MKRTTLWLGALAVLALTAGIALAEDTPQSGAGTTAPSQAPATQPAPSTPTDPSATTPAPATQPDANSAPATQPDANSAPATPAAQPATDAVAKAADPAHKSDPKVTQKASNALDNVSKDVEKTATSDGDQKVAERLAAEFGTTPDALLAEKKDLQTGWGSIVLAHSIMANAANPVTAKQILDQRTAGKSWGQIVDETGFLLGDFVKAAREEAKVAKGVAKPDGQVAMAHGTGSKYGLASAPAKSEKKAKKDVAKADAAKADADKAAASNADAAKAAAPDNAKAAPDATPSPSGSGSGNSTESK